MESYKWQFLGSLPFSLAAMLVAQTRNWGPSIAKAFLGTLVTPGLPLSTVFLFLLVTPVLFGFGYPFFRRAAASLRAGSANMDVLVVLGTSVAYVYSVFFTCLSIRTQGTVGVDSTCFETAAMLITFMLFGKFLEVRCSPLRLSPPLPVLAPSRQPIAGLC